MRGLLAIVAAHAGLGLLAWPCGAAEYVAQQHFSTRTPYWEQGEAKPVEGCVPINIQAGDANFECSPTHRLTIETY